MENNPFAPPKSRVADPELESYGLKRRSLLVMIVFTFISFGVYYPVWWFRRRAGLNRLNSPTKLALWPLLLFASLFVIPFVLAFIRIDPDEDFAGEAIMGVLAVFQLYVGILMIIQAFRVKEMIEDHAAEQAKLSGVMTFFFSIFYLQWAINRYVLGTGR